MCKRIGSVQNFKDFAQFIPIDDPINEMLF